MIKLKAVMEKIIAIIKLVLAIVYVAFMGNKLKSRNIWLISEKYPEARDNGYHLFKYIRNNHPDVEAYYVIEKDAFDLYKIKNFKHIIYANSIIHFIYYLCAQYSISSQPGGSAPEPKRLILRYAKLQHVNQRTIFLQHGIIYNEVSHGFDFSKSHYSLFVCSCEREKNFLESTYHYPPGIVQNIGLCRFDNLINNRSNKKKQILVMPTFRKWLISKYMPKEASDSEKKLFFASEYYKVYESLLNNSRLLNFLKSKGYVIVFYPHYAMQPYIDCFKRVKSDIVIIADRWHFDVQQLLIESSVLITDYSSVFFDFAYMEKPEIYFQFDEDQFRSTHYAKGYFDYKKDGFGPVFEKASQVEDYLIKCINYDCVIEDIYKDRINSFFDNRDNLNCKRTFHAINNLVNTNCYEKKK